MVIYLLRGKNTSQNFGKILFKRVWLKFISLFNWKYSSLLFNGTKSFPEFTEIVDKRHCYIQIKYLGNGQQILSYQREKKKSLYLTKLAFLKLENFWYLANKIKSNFII